MHTIISCSNPYILVIRERCLKYGRRTHFGRAKRSHHDAHLHTLTNVPTKCQPSTPYGIKDKAWTKFMVTMTRSKVKPRSHHDTAQVQALTNVPTKNQLPTPYSFRDIAQKRFYRSRLLQKTLHTYTPNQCPYQVSTSYTLRFLRSSSDKLFAAARPKHLSGHHW